MKPPLSQRAQNVSPSVGVEMSRRAADLAKAGASIVDFGPGQPDFEAPEVVKEAVMKAVRDGHGRYVDPRGLPALREAIAAFETEAHALPVSPDQVVVTPGSFGAISIATRALLDDGDEALILDPSWGPYSSIVRLTGAEPVRVPMPSDAGGAFAFDPDRIRAAITPRTRLIVVNSPWNPTGRVIETAEMEAIAAVAADANLWLLCDEIYSEIVFDGAGHRSIASLGPEVAERSVVINSFSKSFAMTGWRLGYCVAPLRLVPVLERINQYSSRCATSFVQHAGVAALGEGLTDVKRMCEIYQERRDLLVGGLNAIEGITCPVPGGTFYAMAAFDPALGDSRSFANHLLESEGVLLTPGTSYGKASPHHLRFSFATSSEEIRKGLDRLARCVPALLEKAA